MDHTCICVLLLVNTLIYCGHSQGKIKPKLTLKPKSPRFSGETVTLRCVIHGGDTDWEYAFYKYGQVVYQDTKPEYNISPVYTSHSGEYRCIKQHRISQYDSEWSDAVQLTVMDLLWASVNLLSPQEPLYPGDTVTLQCYIADYTDWTYVWYRDNSLLSRQTSKTITVYLPDRAGQYQYQCQGKRTGRPKSSYISINHLISVTDLPMSSVSVSPHGLLYSGETVTLQCDISDYTDWTYWWYKKEQLQSPGSPYKTISTLSDQVSQYQCQGRRRDRPQSSQLSVSFQISVTAIPGKASLRSNQQDVLTGDSVTLTCTVLFSGWRFYWYRHRPDSEPVATTSGSSYTLSQVSVSDGGQYWCRAGRGDPVYYTQYSKPVHIQVTERPKAVLTLQPNWTQMFSKETVTLSCVVQRGGDTDWKYDFYKKGQSVYTDTNPEYRISPVYTSHTGSYTCMGVKGNKFSSTSNAVQLTVSYQSKAVLSISPQWLNPGDSVTLNCEVKDSSTGWRFSWYKTVSYRAGFPSLLDKSYSVEPLSGSGTTDASYTLSPAGPTDTGGYVCRAERGDPVYYTDYSEPQFLWSGDLQSSVSVRISLNRTQHFTSKSLSLSCDLKGNSTGWRLMRYTETGVESGCSPNWRSITGSTCTITSTDTGDSGVYWCESGSGQYSNAVNITVSGSDVILESPAHPVTEGDSVTLHCTYRYQPHTNTKADFYKDGVLISNETTREMTIPSVSKSDEGLYKCKSDKKESLESWVTVRVSGSSTSELVGVFVGLVVAAVLLTFFLVLFCRYRNNKGSCINITFCRIHPQSTNQDPQHDQGSNQVQCLDAGYTDSAGVSASDMSSDVTHAQIQLKKLEKKKEDSVSYINTIVHH